MVRLNRNTGREEVLLSMWARIRGGRRTVPRFDRADDVDFARYVRDGDTVVWGQASAEPSSLVDALLTQRAGIGAVRCFLGLSAGRTVRPEHADHVTFLSYTGGGGNLALYRSR